MFHILAIVYGLLVPVNNAFFAFWENERCFDTFSCLVAPHLPRGWVSNAFLYDFLPRPYFFPWPFLLESIQI